MNMETLKPDTLLSVLSLPEEGDAAFTVSSQFPLFPETDKSSKKISRFYRKKLSRTEAYYKKAFRKARSGQTYPSEISLTYEITEILSEHVSVLRKISFTYEKDVSSLYFSENWNENGDLIFLSDILPQPLLNKRHIISTLYDACISNHTISFKGKLKRCLSKYFSPDNFYFKNNKLYIFYQPGEIAEEKYGFISLPISSDAIIKKIKDRKVKKPLSKKRSAAF